MSLLAAYFFGIATGLVIAILVVWYAATHDQPEIH